MTSRRRLGLEAAQRHAEAEEGLSPERKRTPAEQGKWSCSLRTPTLRVSKLSKSKPVGPFQLVELASVGFLPYPAERSLVWASNLNPNSNFDALVSDSQNLCLSEAGSHLLELWSIDLSFPGF